MEPKGLLCWQTLLRGVLFSLFLNAPSLVVLFCYGGDALSLVNDIDEVFYLRVPSFLVSHQSMHSFYLEEAQRLSLYVVLTLVPYAPLNYFIGLLGLSPVELGVLLDIVCSILSYVTFSAFFSTLTGSRFFGESAAVSTLFLEWPLSAVYTVLPKFLFGIDYLVGPTFGSQGDLPVLRGINTQVSYPLSGLALYYGALAFKSSRISFRSLLLSGILSGLLLSIYFFAWGAVVAVLGLVCWFVGLQNGSLKSSIKLPAVYAGATFLGSLPGFALIFGTKSGGIATWEALSSYYYISIVNILLLAVLGFLVWKLAVSDLLKTILFFCCAALIAELVLMNLQPALQSVMATYHFPVLYLHPLLQGLGIAFILKGLLESGRGLKFARLVAAIPIALTLVVFSFKTYQKLSVDKVYSNNFQELVEFLNNSTSEDSVIAAVAHWKPFEENVSETFKIRAMPNAINLFTGRNLLHQDWLAFSKSHSDVQLRNMERELYSGWIYSGKIQPLWPCLDVPPKLPGDTFSLTWTAYQINRFFDCKEYRSHLAQVELCDLINKYQLDYVLFEKWHRDKPPEEVAPYLEEVWRPTDAQPQFTLYRFKPELAQSALCTHQNGRN